MIKNGQNLLSHKHNSKSFSAYRMRKAPPYGRPAITDFKRQLLTIFKNLLARMLKIEECHKFMYNAELKFRMIK